MSAQAKYNPTVYVTLRLYRFAEGGLRQPVYWRLHCPAELQGEFFDCRLYFNGLLAPGETEPAYLHFLSPDLALPLLHLGASFRLWAGRFFAEATVLALPIRWP